MSEPVLTLRDVVDQARTKQDTSSNSALMRIARAAGYRVSHTTLSAILKGDYPSKPSRDTIEALVYLSGISHEDVQRAAGLEPGIPYVPPEVAERLTVKQRELVNSVIRALVEAGENASADSGYTERVITTPNVESDSTPTVPYLTDSDLDDPNEGTRSSESR